MALHQQRLCGKTSAPSVVPVFGSQLPESPPVSAQFFLQQCLIGLTNGALVALVALGYTMVYGIIGLINFAHGDLIMLGPAWPCRW